MNWKNLYKNEKSTFQGFLINDKMYGKYYSNSKMEN